jgi:cytochrome P450
MSTEEQQTDVPMFNPFEPGYHENPYAQYARLRAHEPVHRTAIGPWLFSGYAESERLLRDPSLSIEFDSSETAQTSDGDLSADGGADAESPAPLSYSYPQIVKQLGLRERILVLHSIDPPEHTRLSRLIGKVFNPSRLEQLRPRTEAIVDALLGEAATRGEIDAIADLAFPLPVQVISEMLGIPDEDCPQLSEWSHRLGATLDPILPPEEVKAAAEATVAMVEYMTEAISRRRAEPREDLLTALTQVREDGEGLSDDEILDNAIFLYAAGHETTVNLIGNGLLALLEHPDQLHRLRVDPELTPNAVEECLRYDSPVQFTRRITTADVEFGGRSVPAHSIVLVCLGAANHDPDFWGPTAADFDIEREGARRHLSFGHGVHRCLGAALGRVEAQAALGALVQRFPGLTLAGEPKRNNRIVLRGLNTLPVKL